MLLPVVVFLSFDVEAVVVRVGFVPLPVFELDMQAVFLGAGQLVDDLIPQPVLPRRLSKALNRTKRYGIIRNKKEKKTLSRGEQFLFNSRPKILGLKRKKRFFFESPFITLMS